jgi:hypothetical protein
MNTIVAGVLQSKSTQIQADARPLHIVALFCGIGLLASLCMAYLGLDVSGGGF